MCLCGLKPSNVDEESFVACHAELVEYVTFRARLSGTSDYSSEYLVTLLADWVSTTPAVNVVGVLRKVRNNELNCSTILSDIEGENCLKNDELQTIRNSDVSSSSSLNEGTAIGSSFATIFGVALAAISALFAICFCKKEKDRVSCITWCKDRKNELFNKKGKSGYLSENDDNNDVELQDMNKIDEEQA